MTEGHEARKVTRQAKISLLVLVCLSVALVSVAVVIVWAELRENPTYDPLHYTVPQTVTSRVESLGGAPATRITDTVDVTGEKCADEAISVLSTVAWKPVDPRGGSIVTTEHNGAFREEGCVVSQYENEIPPAVVDAVTAQHARGVDAPLWQIQGVETPISPEGTEGSPEVWTTEPFAIVP